MIRLVLRRLAASCLLLYLVLTLTFFVIRLAPGGPLALFENPRFTRAQMERLEEIYGLDQPLPVQYVQWLWSVTVEGDWGLSFSHQRPALQVVLEAIPNTFVLAITALMAQYIVGIVLGVVAARRRNSALDHLVRTSSLVLYSVPGFWLGLMLLLLFHLHWRLLPAGGVTSVDADSLPWLEQLVDRLKHLVLPTITLGVATSGRVARFVRNQLLEVLQQSYIATARAKGISERRVLWVHGLRNSLVPIVQLFGLSLPAMLNGALVTEVVFAWPGLGRMTFNSCLARDYPVILVCTAVSALLVILGNFLADLLHGFADPRVRRA